MMTDINGNERRIVLLSALGGSFEFYNYMIYIIFAPVISQVFLPQTNSLAALISIYAISALGYFARPLGGVIFSHFGDRHGRKTTFIYSISLMAISTFMIGVLPSYQQAGLFASVGLVVFVLLQNLSVGGETSGAITFACEHAGAKKYGLVCGVIIAFLNVGILIGMCVNALLEMALTHAQLVAYGWRIPFILGGMMGLIALHLRRKMTESPVFLAYQRAAQQERQPLLKTVRDHWRAVLQGIAVTWLGAVVINVLFVYLPTYLITLYAYPAGNITLLNTLNLFVYSFLIIMMGVLSDKIGRRIVLLFGSIGLVVLSYSIFASFYHHSTSHLLLAMLLISILSACAATYPSVLVELFPPAIRYTGVALTFNLGAIFGGMSPLIVTFLIRYMHDSLAPSYYLAASAFICAIVTATLKNNNKNRVLDVEMAQQIE